MNNILNFKSSQPENSQYIIGVVFLLSLIIGTAYSSQIYVPADYPTIQRAIDMSNIGDEIIVSPNTYYENIYFKGKNIILRSTNPQDTEIVKSTIIDAMNIGRVVSFTGTENEDCRLSGFTITNGKETEYGGGILGNGCKALIDFNIISWNSSFENVGGGLFACDGTIKNNLIQQNTAKDGGGLFLCNGLIEGNSIISNSCKYFGGGIASSDAIIRNNVINTNSAKFGGGLDNCNVLIEDNDISYNMGRYGMGISRSNGIIRNNSIRENTTEFASPIGFGAGLWECNGIIQSNTISYNYAETEGGGIFECGGIIFDNIIEYNISTLGGGISYCSGSIRDNIIRYNTAYDYGGGIAESYCPIINNLIENNHSSDGGGGIYSCPRTIMGNTIQNNSTDFYGGGMYLCSGLIKNNTIKSNTAQYGGGLYNCNGAILNNIIQKNNVTEDGGGLYLCNGGEISFNEIISNEALRFGGGVCNSDYNNIKHNKISFNIAGSDGGGFYNCDSNIIYNVIEYNEGGGLSVCNGNITNNIISNNLNFTGGGLYDCNGLIGNNIIFNNVALSGGGLHNCNGTITNCIIWGNEAFTNLQINTSSDPTYSCIQEWLNGGIGNITTDPLFVNSMNGDFHLQTGSPCIDAGNPGVAFNDACLPPGLGTEINDMGAYGGPNNCETMLPLLTSAISDLTAYGDVWGAANNGAPPFEMPARWGWPGFRFEQENGWYPLKGNVNAYGIDDIIQITEYGDAWVATSGDESISSSERWGWLGFKYQENTDNGWLPLSGDVDGTGSDDLIQVTEYGDAWVAISMETKFNPPKRWGWLGFEFSRGELGTPGAIPLTGDANGDGLCDLIQVTKYGDAWVATSVETMYNPPTRWGWLGFKYAPFDGWYPLCGDVNGDGADDLIQITPTGDPWVSLSTKSAYSAPTRWGWPNFYYDEAQRYYPLLGDVNTDGMIDLIQITPSGEALVAPSTGISFDSPEHWGWLGFQFDRDKGYLPFYLDY